MPVGVVIRADEFLLFHQFVDNLPVELRETFRKSLAENFKTAMPAPEIQNPVPRSASCLGLCLAFHFSSDVTFRLPQKPCPDSVPPEYRLKLSPFTFSDPEPAVDDEPRRCQSFRCALYFGDDFLRHRSRSLLIARKVHGIFRAALGRRTHVGRVAKHFCQRNDGLDYLRTGAVLHAFDAAAA